MQLIELLGSWAVQWNFTMSLLLQILLSLSPDVQRVQMVWFQQARSCYTRVHSDYIDVDIGNMSQAAEFNLT